MRSIVALPTVFFLLVLSWSCSLGLADQTKVIEQLKSAEATIAKLSAVIQDFLGANKNVTDAATHDEIVTLGGKLWGRQVQLNDDMQDLGDFIGIPSSGEDLPPPPPNPSELGPTGR